MSTVGAVKPPLQVNGLHRPAHRRLILRWAMGTVIPLVAWGATLLGGRGMWPADAYLWAARQMAAGEFGAHVYDDEAVSQSVARATSGRVSDILSPSPPTLPMFFVPLSALSPSVISLSWAAAHSLALILVGYAMVRLLRWPRAHPLIAGCALAALLLSAPMIENLGRGQIYIWLLAAFTLVLYGISTRRDWLAGLSLGVAFLTKLAGWPVWLLLVCGRVRALWWALGSVSLVALLSLPWIGVQAWWHYAAAVIPRWLFNPVAAVPAYQTIGGLSQHLFRFDPQWNPAPVADRPALAALLAGLAAAVLVVVTLVRARRRPLVLSHSAALLLSVVLAPVAEQYHYVMAFLPWCVALEAWLDQRRPWGGALVAASALLMFAPLPYKNPALWSGWISLLSYPRLWGALLLWAYLMWHAPRPDAAALFGDA